MGHDAILYTKPTFKKAGGHSGPELTLLHAHPTQHSEELDCCGVQFEEEDSYLKRLRQFILKGTSSKIKDALQAIRDIKKAKLAIDPTTLSGLIELEIHRLQPQIAEDLTQTMGGSVLEGIKQAVQQTAKHLEDDVAGPSQPSPAVPEVLEASSTYKASLPILDEAVSVLRSSPVAAGIDYRDTAEKVRQGAFAVTKDLSDSAVAAVRDSLAQALEEGLGKDEFVDLVDEKLGGKVFSDHHIENIFRTNALSALSTGKKVALEQPMVVDAFPYVAYFATRDSRVREEHWALESLGLNGTNIYRFDDPTFKKFRPPWSYNCRCVFYPQTVEQAANKGVQEAQQWLQRAKDAAQAQGGSYNQYLDSTKPENPEYVTPPSFEPPPEFKRVE